MLFSFKDEETPRQFFKVHFANKGLDAINISNILHHKAVQSKIPPYFQDTSTPLISYTYTKPIASKIFNHKKVLQDFNIDDLQNKPLTCSCSSSPFNYIRMKEIWSKRPQNNILRQVYSKIITKRSHRTAFNNEQKPIPYGELFKAPKNEICKYFPNTTNN